MHLRQYRLLIGLLLVTCLAVAAVAQSTQPAADGAGKSPGSAGSQPSRDVEKPASEGVLERPAVTEHEIAVGGGLLKYRSTAAKMLMKDDEGKTKATMFFVAYEQIRPAEADPADRPVTFVFNGGPGAAAIWLHLGTAGPERIALNELGEPPAPPYALSRNPNTWLDVSDLVFIDPVGTGFSRAAQGEKAEQFYGVKEDIRSVADFIRLYTTQYRRWLSPKFLAGESYGTTRAAGLSEYLLDNSGIALNGIVLISSVLDFQTIAFGDANDLPYVVYLPTYTATAWHHKKLPAELQADLDGTLREVQHWATHEYLTALAAGGRLPAEQRRGIAEKLARYTGLPVGLIEENNLRIKETVFRKQLLADRRQILGRFDARISAWDPDPAARAPEFDPSLSGYLPVYMATFNDYVRRTLKYESDLPYEALSRQVGPWKWGDPGFGYLYVADNLRSAMAKNPHLKVLFVSGLCDLATPFFSSDYTIDHMGLTAPIRENVTHVVLPGGHMLYHYQPSQARLHEEVAEFMRSALPKAAATGHAE